MEENRTNQEPRRTQPVRRRRRRRSGIGRLFGALLYVAFVIGVSVLLATFGWTMANDVLALNKVENSAVIVLTDDMFNVHEVDVEKEDDDGNITTQKQTVGEVDIEHVSQMLEDNGMVENAWLFELFSKVTGSDTKMRPGTYTLDTNMDYRALITNMGSSSVSRATVMVTFVEGSTVDQIFAQMEEYGVSTVAELQNMAATHDYAFSFLQEIPLGDHHRLEGYLFPDTYEFYLDEDPKTAINKLLVNFDAKFTDEMREKVAQTQYSIYDIVTIASMIEKETDGSDEKTISSVIYNRLESNETAGFLNIDATILYGTGGTVVDTAADTPYNTYTNKGLPPGPIANPGMAAINAALNPDSTNYYYYVLNPETNRHEYSTNYNDHVNLVNKYAGS